MSENRDKDVRIIDIQVEQPPSMEKIEKEISVKLRSEHVQDLLCTPGDEVVISLRSIGPFPNPPPDKPQY